MPRILLVEDDPFIAEIYTKKLSSSGFEVDQARTGREVLKRVKEQPYDLVLLDMVLPELSGLEVLTELRSKPAEFDATLRVVVFSNLSSPEERQAAIQAGADGFISKTEFTPSQTVDEVQRYLEQFSQRERNAVSSNQSRALAASGPAAGVQEKRRLLLIEDEAVFVEMFGKALRDAGYDVTTETMGDRGLALALQGGFDLVITDHLLPLMSGKEIIARLRDNEATRALPIFLFTASLEQEEIQALEASGTVDRTFLKTKIIPSELAEAVNAFFRNE
jgi:two-component system, sensor histidine kinase and response regulator